MLPPPFLVLCALFLASIQLAAAADAGTDFAALAKQRPWICPGPDEPGLPASTWQGEAAQCAWQNRLRMRRWSGPGGAEPGACVSAQARWWYWARSNGGSAAPRPQGWRSAWPAQSVRDERGAEKRFVIIERMADGRWSATEWRWNPSPRSATRRWQQGRWALLAERAAQLRQHPRLPSGPAEARMLRSVLESNLGSRVAEIGSDVWQWQADGLCLRVDTAGLGPRLLQLPYSVDDSRLEQRAAMQLQLARRYPKATWLTTFRLMPALRHVRSGAKFYAVWTDHGVLKGQLWIPTRNAGPLVRILIDTALPATEPGEQALAHAAGVVERELVALAARWTYEHE